MSNGRFDPREEVRFAVVLYGGVSLAIYINGVVQELFSLVRATAPQLDSDGAPTGELLVPDAELTPVERVYRRLGCGPGDGETVARRFVVDIISGASAGGINGVYLAKALANGQSIESLKDLWVDKGGIEALLNDSVNLDRLDRINRSDRADSLFSGDLMYLELLDALDMMDEGTNVAGPDGAAPSPYVEELDLWLTSTDLAGIDQPIQLAGREIREHRHRHPFHFVFGEAQAESGRRNELHRSLNPLLAFTARATSSFPFAFEPARLADIGRVTRRSAPGTMPVGGSGAWRMWFRPHSDRGDFDFENISFSDGGALDNKPFGWAIDTLATRTSTTPVDRRLLYVEPDPSDIERREEAARMPNLVDSITTSFTLGRVENIRGDIARLAERSEIRGRVGAATASIEEGYRSGATSEAETLATSDWLEEGLEQMAARGLSYAAYYRLRIDTLVGDFARSMAQLPWSEPSSRLSRAFEVLVGHWVATEFRNPFEAGSEPPPSTKVLLRNYDIAFRVRRLAFVAAQADRLMRADPEELQRLMGTMSSTSTGSEFTPQQQAEFAAEARRVKRILGEVESGLRMWVPSIRSNRAGGRQTIELTETDPDVARLLSGDPEQVAAVWAARRAEFLQFADAVAEFLRAVFGQASDPVKKLFGEPDDSPPATAARVSLHSYYRRFADFDQVIYPLQVAAGVIGEVDPVQVHRLSPDDTDSLIDHPDRPKLAGDRLGHFGGFVAADWRRNDIMWGRLDAVETLITVLSEEPSDREALINQAQDAVLVEEWFAGTTTDQSDAAVEERRDRFTRDFAVPPWPDSADILDTAARGSRVMSRMFGDLAADTDARLAHRAVAGVGFALSGLAVVALAGRYAIRLWGSAKRGLGGPA